MDYEYFCCTVVRINAFQRRFITMVHCPRWLFVFALLISVTCKQVRKLFKRYLLFCEIFLIYNLP